jgi:predicted DNA-binding transcriptional regulator AlpA
MSQVASVLVRIGSYFVPREELASIAEVAEILGVTRRTAHRYVDRKDFPEPVGRLAAGRVWLRADVKRWAKQTLPLPEGRPRKESNG